MRRSTCTYLHPGGLETAALDVVGWDEREDGVRDGLVHADRLRISVDSRILIAPMLNLVTDSDFEFLPGWIPAAEADALFQRLLETLSLRQESILIAGKSVLQPRLSLWMGDANAIYRYSGRTFVPADWNPEVLALLRRVEEAASHPFNSVLLNLYRDGADSMGYHADDEPELGARPVIASVSLGAARRFVLKPSRKGARAAREYDLTNGSLLIMRGASQENFVHRVPKEPGVRSPRLNLTFRQVNAPGAERGTGERTHA